MSLQDVKVGDEVMVVESIFRTPKVERCPVTAVARKYFTAGGRDFERGNGRWRNKEYGHHRCAYSLAQWARREADDALRGVLRRLGDVRSFAALSDEEVRDITATLQGVAERLEKKP